ncbi:MAG: hypothetical protein ACTSU5_14405 [Promethearchaeota archaeon]
MGVEKRVVEVIVPLLKFGENSVGIHYGELVFAQSDWHVLEAKVARADVLKILKFP